MNLDDVIAEYFAKNDKLDYNKIHNDFCKKILTLAYKYSSYNISQCAIMLSMPRTSCSLLLRKYNISPVYQFVTCPKCGKVKMVIKGDKIKTHRCINE